MLWVYRPSYRRAWRAFRVCSSHHACGMYSFGQLQRLHAMLQCLAEIAFVHIHAAQVEMTDDLHFHMIDLQRLFQRMLQVYLGIIKIIHFVIDLAQAAYGHNMHYSIRICLQVLLKITECFIKLLLLKIDIAKDMVSMHDEPDTHPAPSQIWAGNAGQIPRHSHNHSDHRAGRRYWPG